MDLYTYEFISNYMYLYVYMLYVYGYFVCIMGPLVAVVHFLVDVLSG
jgi:hypothetical protein